MGKLFTSAAECVKALRQITSTPALLKQNKQIYSDIISETVPFISEMTPQDIRVLSKSVLIINKKFELNLNNFLFKLINKRLNIFIDSSIDPGTRHALVSTMLNLSQVSRQTYDGGPPALRPDTVWRFTHAASWRACWQEHSSGFDKADLLSVLGRMLIRPLSETVFKNESLTYTDEPKAIFLSACDIDYFMEHGRKSNGRIVGSISSMSKLDVSSSPVFDRLLTLIPPRIDDLSIKELSNTLHAITSSVILRGSNQESIATLELAQAIVKRLFRKRTELTVSVVNQIALVQFTLPSLIDNVKDDAIQGFCQQAIRVAEADTVNEITQSKAQKVIRNAIDSLGLANLVKEEFSVGPYRIDFAIPDIGMLIEINGPYHYYYKTTEPTAKFVLKRKSLKDRGYKIVEIDYLEMKDESNRVALLENKIRACLGLTGSKRSLRNDVLALIKNR